MCIFSRIPRFSNGQSNSAKQLPFTNTPRSATFPRPGISTKATNSQKGIGSVFYTQARLLCQLAYTAPRIVWTARVRNAQQTGERSLLRRASSLWRPGELQQCAGPTRHRNRPHMPTRAVFRIGESRLWPILNDLGQVYSRLSSKVLGVLEFSIEPLSRDFFLERLNLGKLFRICTG